MTDDTHTPLPWIARYGDIVGAKRNDERLYPNVAWDLDHADATLIVRACNSHYELLAELESVTQLLASMQAAIAAAAHEVGMDDHETVDRLTRVIQSCERVIAKARQGGTQ